MIYENAQAKREQEKPVPTVQAKREQAKREQPNKAQATRAQANKANKRR
jgi:hypothetical protein